MWQFLKSDSILSIDSILRKKINIFNEWKNPKEEVKPHPRQNEVKAVRWGQVAKLKHLKRFHTWCKSLNLLPGSKTSLPSVWEDEN